MLKKVVCLFSISLVLALLVGSVSYAIDYSSKDVVRDVQQALNDAGFDCGIADGIAGNKTKTAISDYRTSKGLKDGDFIDDELMISLGLIKEELVKLNAQYARAAIVVAFTNRYATDVFTEDGSDYAPEKFHAYGDETGYYLVTTDRGDARKLTDGSWHVSGLKMQAANNENAKFVIDADVKVEKNKYIVFNIQGTAPSYENASDLEAEWDYEICFIIPPSLIPQNISKIDRSAAATKTNSSSSSYSVKPSGKKKDLREDQAKRAFEIVGKSYYPYGFTCHWFSRTYDKRQYDDGSWWFKVGVTITNEYGASMDATAEATINNTTESVEGFTVY